MVRNVVVRGLREEGYEVLAAESGADALAVLERQGDGVSPMITDVAMAELGGHELGQRVDQPFLQKPFAPAALLESVRSLLDAARCVSALGPPSAAALSARE